MRKILLVFAHPDDESFASAGTVAKYVAAGWQADLVCATRGEAGGRGPYAGTPETLADIRQKELERAGRFIGLSSITFLGYKDGTLTNLHSGELEDKIYREMVRLAPDIIVTFEPTGGISNHPDHQKIAQSTTFAFQKYAQQFLERQPFGRRAASKDRKVSLADTWAISKEPKLYYACIPETIVEYLKKKHVLPPVMFGKPWAGIPDKYVTTVVDIRRFRSIKIKALRAHTSQSDDVNRFLSYDQTPLSRQEYFILRMEGVSEVFMGKNDRVSKRL